MDIVARLLRYIVAAIVLIALAAIVEPFLRASFHTAWIISRPVPGALPMPVDRVAPETVQDSWHAPRSGERRHEGVDIFAPRGAPVRSTTAGVIVRVRVTALGGRVVWVLGPGGQRHYYAHLARFADVAPGQPIKAGSLLGYVGNSGNARNTPPHLHYGIYTAAGAINPYPLLRSGSVAGP